MLQSLANLFYRLPKRLQHPLERTWYECVSWFDEFAAMEGTNSLYATLCSGDKVYMRFVLRKQQEV